MTHYGKVCNWQTYSFTTNPVFQEILNVCNWTFLKGLEIRLIKFLTNQDKYFGPVLIREVPLQHFHCRRESSSDFKTSLMYLTRSERQYMAFQQINGNKVNRSQLPLVNSNNSQHAWWSRVHASSLVSLLPQEISPMASSFQWSLSLVVRQVHGHQRPVQLPMFTVQYTGCKIVCVSTILLTRAHPHNNYTR